MATGKNCPTPWNDADAVPFIRIENVTKRFGDFVAVNNVSLDIYRNELFSLLGGSGCGKTTLLRMLAGFESPTEGRIFIDGVDMAGVAAYQRPTNMMFQSYALFPHMTVEQNIAFGLKQDNVPPKEIEERVNEALSMVQLAQFGKRKPHQLSGGQRQRVALARALVKRPKVLLLDEPLGALDKKLREETQFELVNIQEKVGITFIVVTHDQEEAMTLSTRIAVMNAGQIVQTGTPSEVYEYPNARFVANFLGSVNVFEGVITLDQADQCKLDSSDDLGAEIFIPHGVTGTLGMTKWVAIRPEKLVLSREAPKDPHNCAKGMITDIAYLGDCSIYRIKLANTGKIVKATQTNVKRWSADEMTWDEEVWISWSADNAVVLSS